MHAISRTTLNVSVNFVILLSSNLLTKVRKTCVRRKVQKNAAERYFTPPPPTLRSGGGRSPHVTFVYEKTIFVDFTSNIVKTTYPKIFRL